MEKSGGLNLEKEGRAYPCLVGVSESLVYVPPIYPHRPEDSINLTLYIIYIIYYIIHLYGIYAQGTFY